MPTTRRFSGWARGMLILFVCALALGAPAAQAARVTQPVDNTLAQFTRGTFQRTALSSARSAADPADELGAVQLVPVGTIAAWLNSPFLLPEPLSNIGAVAVGKRIYVIGGTRLEGTNPVRSDRVYWTSINQSNGAPETAWQLTTPLPAVKTNDQPYTNFGTPFAPRSVPAVASVQTDAQGSGWIYVIGGNVNPVSSFDISSYAISIGRVNGTSGAVTWLPDTGGQIHNLRIPNGRGLQSASAITFTTTTGTYLYVIGGLKRYREGPPPFGNNTKDVGSPQVFYARVNLATGLLTKPSNGQPGWDLAPPIPIPGDLGTEAGLWDAVAVAGQFEGGNAIYLAGGQLRAAPDARYSNVVYRADIGANGAITWASWQGTLPEARIGMDGVEYNEKLYLTGGEPAGGRPQRAVLTSVAEPDLTLPTIGDQGSNFLRNENALPIPRTRHASVVIPAGPTEPKAAYVYVLAGRGNDLEEPADDDLGSTTVIYGKVGLDEETEERGFATSGWYYSAPHDTVFTGAQVEKVDWTTVITRTGGPMDIAMEYRVVVTNNPCDSPNAFEGVAWQPLDGTPADGATRSAPGFNSATLPVGIQAHCFQYRALLTSEGNPPPLSPALLNVKITVIVPGSPDLTVPGVTPLFSGDKQLNGLTVVIENRNGFQQTLPADLEGGGSFFVDLWVFGPGETVRRPTLPLTPSNTQGSDLYANIEKSVMGVNSRLTINTWCDSRGPANQCRSVDILSLFKQPGMYTVVVAVDSFDYVEELPNPAEGNNITQSVQFEVKKIGHLSLLPMIFRQ